MQTSEGKMYKEFKDLLNEVEIYQPHFDGGKSVCKASMYPLSVEDLKYFHFEPTIATGYSVANGALPDDYGYIATWLRDGLDSYRKCAKLLNFSKETPKYDDEVFEVHALRPAFEIKFGSKSVQKKGDILELQIGRHKTEIFQKGIMGHYHIRLLSMRAPQTLVKKPEGLKKTSKTCIGRCDKLTGYINYYPVFEKDGEFYTIFKAEVSPSHDLSNFDGVGISDGITLCAKIEPIELKILNWTQLPKSINPEGSGEAKAMYCVATKGIYSLPFNNNLSQDGKWHNDFAESFLHRIMENELQESMFYEEGLADYEVKEKQPQLKPYLKRIKKVLLARAENLEEEARILREQAEEIDEKLGDEQE